MNVQDFKEQIIIGVLQAPDQIDAKPTASTRIGSALLMAFGIVVVVVSLALSATLFLSLLALTPITAAWLWWTQKQMKDTNKSETPAGEGVSINTQLQ